MANRELNDVKINVEFQETTNRQQLSSGDEIKTLFGKIKRWFSDLKPVAFTGKYSDLKRLPYIPSTCVVSNKYDNSIDTLYFPIAWICPAGNEINSSAFAYFDIFTLDWDQAYERCSVHFASWDSTNQYYIDGMGCTSMYKSNSGVNFSNLLFGVSDEVDSFVVEVWIKVPVGNMFGIKLFAAGSYQYDTGEGWMDYVDYGSDYQLGSIASINTNPQGYAFANLPEYVTSKDLFFGSLT